MQAVDNDEVAAVLERVADLLEVGHASPHRVRAYRGAAETVRGLDRAIADVVDEGHEALEALPRIGERIAGAITEIVRRGTFGLLERLEGETAPEDLLASVPGIGPELAQRIHATLGIETLEELEIAAHDGRLDTVEGFGPRRVQAIRHTLDAMLRRAGRRRARRRPSAEVRAAVEASPSEQTILDIDAEYRRLVEQDRLRKIAPRRFNPTKTAWLPIWHTERDGWDFDVLFSNTARAHELDMTHDWVVIYYGRGDDERQCTVVTDRTGHRRVRGLHRP